MEVVRDILQKDRRPSGTVSGTYYVIPFVQKQLVPTSMVFSESRGEPGQVDLRDNIMFGSLCTSTSAATLPIREQSGYDDEGDTTRSTGRLLQDPGNLRKALMEGQVSSSTDPVVSPTKDQPRPTPSDAVVGQANGNLRVRNICV